MSNYQNPNPRAFAATYSADILPEMQNSLASLADLDIKFDLECSALEEPSLPEAVRKRLRRRLDRARTDARQPHVALLADLHQHVTFSAMFRGQRDHH